MTVLPPFEVSDKDIARLSDVALRELVARLCRAELAQAGLPLSAVTAGGGQDDPDGGIDVRVELPPSSPQLDFVARARTGFQVKAKRMDSRAIGSEMRPDGRHLRPTIKELVTAPGAYIIVGSKDSTTDDALRLRVGAMSKALGRTPVHPEGRIDFYGADRLKDWTNRYPAVALWVKHQLGLATTGWSGLDNWAHDTPGGEFILDEALRVEAPGDDGPRRITALQAIQEVRRSLAKPGGIVRLAGLAGTGKTRLVQALFDAGVGSDSLPSHMAIYCDVGLSPKPSAEEMLSQLRALNVPVVLIVDNCNLASHQRLETELRAVPGLLSLLTVEYDMSEDEDLGTLSYRLFGLGPDQVDAVVARHVPHLSWTSRQRIAHLSDGNTKVAIALARAARSGSLATLRDGEVFKRLFWQGGAVDSALERAAQVMSLVYSFDTTRASAGSLSEVDRLARMASTDGLTLHNSMAKLKRKGLLQQRGRWRALLPHGLANRLASEALEAVDDETLAEHLWSEDRLLRSFARRLTSLHQSARAREIVSRWLAEGGRLAPIHTLNGFGVDLLELVAPVCPELVLSALSVATARQGEGLLAESGRVHLHRFVSLAALLAYSSSDFSEAAEVLARLAVLEGEGALNQSQSAASALTMLCRPVASGTHAGIAQRIAFIDGLLNSGDQARRKIALACLAAVLQVHWIGSVRREVFGAHPRDSGWRPRSEKEVQGWYSAAIEYVLGIAVTRSDETSSAAVAQVARAIEGLWFEAKATNPLKQLTAVLRGSPHAIDLWRGVATTLARAQGRGRQPPWRELKAIEALLRPASAKDRFVALVFTRRHDPLDPLGEEDTATHGKDGAPRPFHRMLKNAASDLTEHIGDPQTAAWLVSSPQYGYLLEAGRLAGRECSNRAIAWETLVNAFRRAAPTTRTADFLSGFILGTHQKAPAVARQLIQQIEEDDELFDLVLDLYALVGIREREARRILSAALRKGAPAAQFQSLMFGGALNKVPAEVHAELVRAVAALPDGVCAAINLMAMRLHYLGSEDRAVDDYAIGVCSELVDLLDIASLQEHDTHRVEMIARAALAGPEGEGVAAKLSRSLFKAFNSVSYGGWYWERLVAQVLRAHPEPMLNELSRKGRYGSILDVLHHPEKLLREVPDSVLLRWAAARRPERDLWIAGVIDPVSEESGVANLSKLAQTLLARAPDKHALLEELGNHVLPNRWQGAYSIVSASRAQMLERFGRSNDAILSSWAKDHLERIAHRIEREKVMTREREESFE